MAKLLEKIPLSLLIPCKNEESNIGRCLRSVSWISESFVVDSQSTDKTTKIAEELGARVVQFNYSGGWPKKKNWALENLPFSYEWVLILDADECLPPEAETEIKSIVSNSSEKHTGYWINRRYFFWGNPLTTLIFRIGTFDFLSINMVVMKRSPIFQQRVEIMKYMNML